MVEEIKQVRGLFGWTVFKVGDLVTRDGTDIHRVVEVSNEGQTITVECVREPLGYLEEDGVTRSEPWCRVGEREFNMARRYQFASEVIDHEVLLQIGAVTQ
ncbi:hypothetical protein AB1K42_15435 [Roseibium algicola]|uniref:hypothetical protein n=1 Tax=Roseibium algicola TaxID=2857014 RepID=UPI0034586104